MDKKHFSFFESYYRSFKGLPPKVIGEIILAMGALYFEDEEVDQIIIPKQEPEAVTEEEVPVERMTEEN